MTKQKQKNKTYRSPRRVKIEFGVTDPNISTEERLKLTAQYTYVASLISVYMKKNSKRVVEVRSAIDDRLLLTVNGVDKLSWGINRDLTGNTYLHVTDQNKKAHLEDNGYHPGIYMQCEGFNPSKVLLDWCPLDDDGYKTLSSVPKQVMMSNAATPSLLMSFLTQYHTYLTPDGKLVNVCLVGESEPLFQCKSIRDLAIEWDYDRDTQRIQLDVWDLANNEGARSRTLMDNDIWSSGERSIYAVKNPTSEIVSDISEAMFYHLATEWKLDDVPPAIGAYDTLYQVLLRTPNVTADDSHVSGPYWKVLVKFYMVGQMLLEHSDLTPEQKHDVDVLLTIGGPIQHLVKDVPLDVYAYSLRRAAHASFGDIALEDDLETAIRYTTISGGDTPIAIKAITETLAYVSHIESGEGAFGDVQTFDWEPVLLTGKYKMTQ